MPEAPTLKWFGVRTIYLFGTKQDGTNVFEERVVTFSATTEDEVLAKAEREARDLVFVIGGADGLPSGWRERAGLLLSLSAMTYPHELARVMLAEQVYRAFATLRGHPYPK